ncbi:hypothetical protein SLH49_11540 [Cognatiyoonia sp. IB215446]|uniref:hypothetical protein n=1 Tax=Cognatiyoonia sp. IB215446 TaxID=3097355 RepID=UPI002A0AA7D8|nr:hypothetical protein [Cognatiyoonia sp. IB215446]MDX8348617.1 hypothetical protein [Cognatiyoonia sp. IB215446]
MGSISISESVWFDLIKREMGPSGWQFQKVSSDKDNGILIENSPSTLRALIEQKKGKEDVTNHLRQLLEAILKDVCHSLEVKVAFANEQYRIRYDCGTRPLSAL